jgi:hypothetical protein
MVDNAGNVDLKSVISAYAYRTTTDTNVVFADFLLDPRSQESSGDVRGKQRSVALFLGGSNAGRYSASFEKRRASITSYTYQGFKQTMLDEQDRLDVQITRYDDSWLCGTLTIKRRGKTITRPLAARVSKVE